MPSKSVTSTSYELWAVRKYDLSSLRSWGSAVYVYDTFHKYEKLDLRGKKCIFIRYSEHSKGYMFISKQADGSITELESWDIMFLKNNFSRKD